MKKNEEVMRRRMRKMRKMKTDDRWRKEKRRGNREKGKTKKKGKSAVSVA